MADYIERLHRRRRRQFRDRPRRGLTDRINPLEILSDVEVFMRFRFRPASIIILVGLIIQPLNNVRNNPLPPLLQVLVSLRYLAGAGFMEVVADSVSVSKATVSRCVRKVVTAILTLWNAYVRFPVDDCDRLKQGFFRLAGFPNVVGCVDGTFIRIIRPTDNAGEFINRKGFPSLNVQMVCDYNYRILDCVARWPGSVHDNRVFRESDIGKDFANGTYNGLLLGDSGYQLTKFVMTPYLAPSTAQQIKYNNAHGRTRVTIEQTFGIIKRRFSILHNCIKMKPTYCCSIVKACFVLHNFGIDEHDILEMVEAVNVQPNVDNNFGQDIVDGKLMRNHIANNYFH